MQVYPNDLLKEIKLIWPTLNIQPNGKGPTLPSNKILLELLETVYHASFLTEESRKLSVRILFSTFDEIKSQFDSPFFKDRKAFIKFEHNRPFSKGEILRLAPATDPEKMLIGVELDSKNNLTIWGLADIGSSWWKFIHGQSSGGAPPPDALIISSTNPGNITISREGTIILNLNGGKINKPMSGIFYNGPIYDFFKSSHSSFYQEVCKSLKVKKFDSQDDEYPIRKFIEFLERLIFNIRSSHHGGTLIIVPDSINTADERLKDRINIKYSTDFNRPWDILKKCLVSHKDYYKAFFKLRNSKKLIKPDDFVTESMLQRRHQEIEEAIEDINRFISSLSAIDGAVVITDKYRLLGYGAEVIINSPSLTHVHIAEDVEGLKLNKISIESYGTRHRSAFRFCSSFEDSVAIIISQDGGVKAVKRCGQKVLLWPDINEGDFGI